MHTSSTHIGLILALAGVLATTGCTGGTSPASPSPNASATDVTAAPTPPMISAPAVPARNCGWQTTVGIVPTTKSPKLVAATLTGDIPTVTRLLNEGVDPDVVDKSLSATALTAAAAASCIDVVRMLLNAGANPNLVPPGGTSPLLSAVNVGEIEVVKLLLDSGADPALDGGSHEDTPLHEAVGVGRANILQIMIPYTKNIDSGRNVAANPLVGEDIGSGSALEFAADIEGREPFVSMLLEAGATATITALYRAVRRGSKELVAMLLAAGAPASVSPNETRTMIQVARDAGHPDLAQMLEERSK